MFKSFFLAGFECTAGYNVHRVRIDQRAATQHDRFVADDYRLLAEIGIHAVREGICWSQVDSRGRYNFSTVYPIIEASRHYGMQVVYDLCHFGYPDDLNVFSNEFPKRFADYCYAITRYVAAHTDGICSFTPINEPSYFSWAAGEKGLFVPRLTGRGFELKVCLVRAAIAGINAIHAASPHARIVNVDPICRVVTPNDRPELQQQIDDFNNIAVFQSWDMLCGRLLPELGGSREHLGVIGISYYWTNQWELGSSEIPLPNDDPRRWPLRKLVRNVWERYGGDLLIAETSHVGNLRPIWLRELASEAEALLDTGVPLRGICLYPVLGMPLWHAQHKWLRMGLWDLEPQGPTLLRVPYVPMLEALGEAQRLETRQWATISARVVTNTS